MNAKPKRDKPAVMGSGATDQCPSAEPHRTAWNLACLLPALAVLLVHFVFPVSRPHEDEIYWIGSTYYYHLGVVEGNASSPDWQLLPARENPVLGKYVLGVALQVSGHPVTTPDLLGSFYLIFADIPGAWGTEQAFQKRLAVAMRVDPAIRDPIRRGQALPLADNQLAAARRVMLFFGMLSAIGIAVLGRQCNWTAGGLIAGLLFSLHPIAIEAYSLAMIDIIAIAFCVWFMVGLLAILRFPSRRLDGLSACKPQHRSQADHPSSDHPEVAIGSAWSARQWLQGSLLILFTATMLAFACGSKMNSLVVAATATVCGMGCLVKSVTWRKDQVDAANRKDRSHGAPPNPTQRQRNTAGDRTWMLIAVATLAATLFIGANPTLYGDPVDGVLALSYEHQLTADIQESMLGGRLTSVGQRIQELAKLVCGTPALFAALVLVVVWFAYQSIQKPSLATVIALWWIMAMLLLMIWLPFAWDRYALPLIPPTLLIAGGTVEQAGRWVGSKFAASRQAVAG